MSTCIHFPTILCILTHKPIPKELEELSAITFRLCKWRVMFILQNIIFDCLKPIYNFLRALGVLPVSRRNDSSEFQFHVQSAAMAYSLLIFVVLIVNIAFRFPLTTLSCLMSKIPIADLFQLHSDGSHRHRSNARGTLRGGCNCISLHRQSAANHHRAPDVVRVPEDCSDSQ